MKNVLESHERWATYVTWHNTILGKNKRIRDLSCTAFWDITIIPGGCYSLGLQVENWHPNTLNHRRKISFRGLYKHLCIIWKTLPKELSRTKDRKEQERNCDVVWLWLRCSLYGQWHVFCGVDSNTLDWRWNIDYSSLICRRLHPYQMNIVEIVDRSTQF